MNHKEIVDATIQYVRQKLEFAEGGHDWWHVHRVLNLARAISLQEGGNLFLIELAALLHDIADSKFNGGDEELGPNTAYQYLISINVSEELASEVKEIIRNISYKGGHNKGVEKSIELKIVQDADRLDALGAIGIARAFNYGGHKGRALYDPDIKPNVGMSKELYKKGEGPTLNHFYEKLLLLKDLMNTETGKVLAKARHEFLELYISQFLSEFNLKEYQK